MAHRSVFGPPPRDLVNTRRIRARCRPRKIGLVNSIVDAYEGLAVVRTVDARAGLIELWVPPKEEDSLRRILAGLPEDIELQVENSHGL